MEDLERLAEDYWETLLRHHPLYASMIGERRFDEEVPDHSEEADQEASDDLRAILARADEVDGDALDEDRAVTLATLRFDAGSHLADIEARLAEFAVSPMIGPPATIVRMVDNISITEDEHADALVTRYRRLDRTLDSAADRLRIGVGRDRTPPAITVDHVIAQLDGILGTDLASSPFVATPDAPEVWDEERTSRWRDELADAAAQVVLPALERYRDCLADEILPHARPADRAGLRWLPDGDEVYATQVRQYTTLPLDPNEVHRIGLAEIDALAEEYVAIAGPLFGTDDVPEILSRLREDPELRFSSSEEILETAEGALARAQEAVPDWFGTLPATPCEVREMAEHDAEHGALAFYVRPAGDGSRPGRFFVNTHHPTTRTRYEAEALTFHESVPGHHLQIALAQERDDLPAFQRNGGVTAYIEGWGLYTERLADEMGLYSGDLERLGMLSFDSWRAGRLVVDTGIHALGWSRQQAIDFLAENSPQATNNIENEVDRYIAWPGQALAYKIGQREIVRLRLAADAALDEPDVAGFHDRVLSAGPVPLGVLGDLVRRWVDEVAG